MSAAASMLPSSQRAVPMRMRPDLKIVRVPYQRTPSWVVKDPVALKYFRFQAEQFKILELLDGKRSLEQVRDEFQKEFPSSHLSLEEIQSLVSDLYKSGLVLSERYGQGQALLKLRDENFRQKFWRTIQNILYLRLPGWDPDRTLAAMLPFTRWIFQPIGFFLWTITFFSASLLMLIEFDEFRRTMPEFQQFFGWQNILSMWVIMGGAKVLHEFGHGLSCKHYGGECHEMGMMLLVLSPALYCDVSDSWLLKNKWARIMIGAAGMYVEIFLSSSPSSAGTSPSPAGFTMPASTCSSSRPSARSSSTRTRSCGTTAITCCRTTSRSPTFAPRPTRCSARNSRGTASASNRVPTPSCPRRASSGSFSSPSRPGATSGSSCSRSCSSSIPS